MWKKIIFGIVISLLIAGGIYWFTNTKELRAPVSEAINAIPGNAAFIFESKELKNAWRKLSQGNEMWEELLGTETFSAINSQADYLDSLIQSNEAISQLLDNHSLFISAHVSGATTFDFLYVYSLPDRGYQSVVDDFIKAINAPKISGIKSSYRKYSGVNIITIHPSKTDSVSYSFLDGILIMSAKQTLVEDAIRQMKSGVSLALDKDFRKVLNTAGKNAEAHIYINYKKFPGLFNRFISSSFKNEINSLADLADYSGWDIALKPDALMLNGFTQANDSAVNFLNLFRGQKPQQIALTRIIPSKTALLLFFGISNIKTYHQGYKKYLKSLSHTRAQRYVQYVENLNTKYDINIEKSMLEWMGKEMALVITEPSSNDFTDHAYAVIHTNNIDEAMNSLNALVALIDEKERGSLGTYRNHSVRYLNLPGLLPRLFGWQFSEITNNYYTAVDGYIVFANSKEALQNFIDDFENNKTIAADKYYKAFAENVSMEANIYIYSSIARSPNIYRRFVTGELAKDIENKMGLFHKFEAVGIQFSATSAANKLFYSSVYLKYTPTYKQESGTMWESQLDTTLHSAPHLVINHITNEKEIVVQDDGNKLYLISNKGEILWAKQLAGKINSDVLQIDALRNNKLQLLFNTPDNIYLIDRNGKDVKGFPIKLESFATNGVLLTDYAKNRDYRIFVACENKKIRCFKSTGEVVEGFNFNKTENKVNLPLQYVSIDNKDVLCAIDEKGELYLLNRQGVSYIKMKEKLPENIHSFYIEPGTDFSKSSIITADTIGNIIKMSFTGIRESISIGNFETLNFFDYKDIDNDSINEYIFLTPNELTVFAQDKSMLFSYKFKESISHASLFYTFPDGSGKIGVLSEKTNELFLFNANGSLYKGFPMEGKTLFSIGDLNNEGKYNVITGFDSNVYFYYLE